MRYLLVVFMSFFSLTFLAQEKDFFDLKRIKDVLPDSSVVTDTGYKINIKILKDLGETNQVLKDKKGSFLIVYYNQNIVIAQKDISGFIKENYADNNAVFTRNDFLEKIEDLFFYVTDKKEELSNFNITTDGQPTIAVIDSNSHRLYQVQFGKIHDDFLYGFNDQLITLYKILNI